MTAAQDGRAQFEEWALQQPQWHKDASWLLLRRSDGEYAHYDVMTAWNAWQAYRASLSAEPVAVPHGWKLVPVEPSEEMFVWGMEADCLGRPSVDDDSHVRSIWSAMLWAAHQPAAQERKPLTDEQIAGLDRFVHGTVFGRFNRAKALCRAIERAHGIAGE